ncbi:hypothetical protein GV794_12920 [Nocardia cyriacigeorgica]|uniref:Uncharacterized protein n=1 Tax=Nocardia cyriacigeorgica TaxID=135487 RepID=A0A6P1D256_9NOCA|nr:hypothetical protein [Nocardia cyriacigeorgica]NEW39586.1 hypothetical protein [Nocardia cyriacigeorgica]NEW44645.1 hypothetical protein [Nocardia cyriacigeorgica]NEW50074.1 hypothetical protein [Nocardia cyriacigeorgica]NEW56548.1 hypothetical protein [Nocardia cyriacigeorgica]
MFAASVAGVLIDTTFSHTEIRQTRALPASLRYPDGLTYYLGVVQRESGLLHRRLPDEIRVSRDPGLVYSHAMSLTITGSSDLVLRSVEWRPDGVSARFESGHEIFVPAQSFLGGR